MNDTRRLDDQLQQLHLHYINKPTKRQNSSIPTCAIWRN